MVHNSQLQNADAAILYIMGQSNAHAHEQPLPEAERITVPLKNVHTLHCDENQSFDIDHVVWSGFTTAGYNLGETQDHTASLAYYTAKMWQAAIDSGEQLPDLYIVQISIGAQAMFIGRDGYGTGMWSMDKPKILKPGTLLEVDIALYPLAMHIIRLVRQDLENRFRAVFQLGLHWVGSTQDGAKGWEQIPDLQGAYDRFFDAIMGALGKDCPLAMYRKESINSPNADPAAMAAVNAIFDRQCTRFPGAYLVSVSRSPLWKDDDPYLGVFSADNVHYHAGTQRWFAEILLKRYGVIA